MTHSLEKTLIVAAPPNKVWDHLTKADQLAIWFHKPEADLVAGQDYVMMGQDGQPLLWGHVHQADAPNLLAYSFTARPMGKQVTEVTWTLTALEEGTRIHLKHDGFSKGSVPFSLLMSFDKGWDEHFAKLRKIEI